MSDELESRLAKTDFSADSRVRASLRARLLSRGAAPRFAPSRVAVLSLAFAAAALLVLYPLRGRLRRPAEVSVASSVVLPPAAPAPAPPRPAPAERTAFPRGENGLPVLPGVLAARRGAAPESPLYSRAVGRVVDVRRVDRVIDVRPGVVVREKDAVAVVWVFGGATYRLERRRVTLQDIFETRRL